MDRQPDLLEEFMQCYRVLHEAAPKKDNEAEVTMVTITGSRVVSHYHLIKTDQFQSKLKGLDPVKDLGLTVASIPGEDGSDGIGQRGILCRLEEANTCPKVSWFKQNFKFKL